MQTQDLLLPCGNNACEEKWFVYRPGESLRCPWCNWEQRDAIPVLEFLYAPAGRRGQYRPTGHRLTGYDQRGLLRSHVFQNVRTGEDGATEVLAYIRHLDSRWVLVNNALTGLQSAAGNRVPIGQACALHDGDELLLSNEEHGRMVMVKMVK